MFLWNLRYLIYFRTEPGQKSSFAQLWSMVPRMVHSWFNDESSLDHAGSIHGNETWKNRGQRFLIELIDWLHLHLLLGRTMVLPRFNSLNGSAMIQPCSMVEALMPFSPDPWVVISIWPFAALPVRHSLVTSNVTQQRWPLVRVTRQRKSQDRKSSWTILDGEQLGCSAMACHTYRRRVHFIP